MKSGRHVYHIAFDGGSRGNPGPAAVGIVVKDPDQNTIILHGEMIGEQTNNVAEYRGLLRAIELLHDRLDRIETKPSSVGLHIQTDSRLLEKQMKDEWDTNDTTLQDISTKIRDLLKPFGGWHLEHIMRENNEEADRLVNEVLDARENDREEKASSSHSTPSENENGLQPISDEETPCFSLYVHGLGGEGGNGTLAFRLLTPEGDVLLEDGNAIQGDVTSNVAVYRAIQEGTRTLKDILNHVPDGVDPEEESPNPEEAGIDIYGINNVVLKQLTGEYDTNNAELEEEKKRTTKELISFSGVRTARKEDDHMSSVQKKATAIR